MNYHQDISDKDGAGDRFILRSSGPCPGLSFVVRHSGRYYYYTKRCDAPREAGRNSLIRILCHSAWQPSVGL